MEVGALLIIAAMLLLMGMAVIKPFFNQEPQEDPNSIHADPFNKLQNGLSELVVQHELILEQILELETQFHQEKIPVDAFTYARQRLTEEGATVLLQLDMMESVSLTEKEEQPYGFFDQHDHQIEMLVTEHRKHTREKMIGFCPKCGKPAQKSDHFCSRCGFKLER